MSIPIVMHTDSLHLPEHALSYPHAVRPRASVITSHSLESWALAILGSSMCRHFAELLAFGLRYADGVARPALSLLDSGLVKMLLSIAISSLFDLKLCD